MLGRRSFLKFLSAAPMAGKTAADAAIAQLSGVAAGGLSVHGMTMRPVTYSGGPPTAEGTAPGYDAYVAAANYVKAMGLPSFAENNLRAQAWNVGSLDPDIANKVSWSMAFKIVTQRQRNYERLVQHIHDSGQRSMARKVVEKLIGGYWPW